MSNCNLINTARLFSHVLPSIGSKDRIIEEIVENSVRAGASKLNLSLIEENGMATLLAENDGAILEDFTSLLKVADSHYDEKVLVSHQPAGMGIYIMISAATHIVFHSGNNALHLECQKFLHDEEYRNNLLDTVYNVEPFEGFRMIITFDGGVNFIRELFSGPYSNETDVKSYVAATLQYYPLDICYNGDPVERSEPKFIISKMGEGALEGVRIGILEKYFKHARKPSVVFWHGKGIESDIGIFSLEVSGDIVTKCVSPKLPDRTDLTDTSDTLRALAKEIERQLHDEIQDFLNTNEDERLLGDLTESYDVEHFTCWKEAKKGKTEIVLTTTDEILFSLVESNNDLLNEPKRLFVCNIEFGDAPIKEGNSRPRGNTKPPKWYLDLLFEKTPHLVVYGDERNNNVAGVGNYWIYPAKKMLLEGHTIDAMRDDDNEMYASLEADDLSNFFQNAAESFSEWESRGANDQLWEDWEAVQNAIMLKVNGVRELFVSLRLLAGASHGAPITTINFDLNSSEINYAIGEKNYTVFF